VPTVDLQLDADVDPLPDDTTARLRPRGLLGPLFVDLVPGTSTTTLPDGARIGVRRVSASVQLAQVLDTFDPDTREGARLLLRGLGGGVAGRGAELNAANEAAPALLRDVSKALHPLVDRPGVTSTLISAVDAFSAALEPIRNEIAAGFADGEAALHPFVAERAALSQTLQVAPHALPAIRGSLARTDPVLTSATRFARSATRFTAVAPRALDALALTLRDGRAPLADARAVLESARQAARPTLMLTDALNPVLPRLERTLQVAREPSRILGKHSCGIEGWASGWRAFLTRAPAAQSGPLGPATVLRTVVASPGGLTPAVDPKLLPDNGIDDSPVPGPCPQKAAAR